ncbi:hypothetical protein GH714_014022 [Hevea brasiliensis]|uniref:Uncharacterized protein n=1 Tax=Hevea brasiliensis TaxID=3981 RepID=A0A6A6LJ33_HEVBR|nr:hypothetical protein GH714_014022 [Hevea brasiliensis]
MGRQPCCDKVGLKKGPWTAEEDKKLMNFILNNGQCCWRAVPKLAGLLRCGKSCRLRWTNYLRPDLKRGLLSEYEEKMVIDLHAQLGNRFDTSSSGIVFVIHYSCGRAMMPNCRKVGSRMQVDDAEAKAASFALQHALKASFSHLLIETESLPLAHHFHTRTFPDSY